MYGIYTNFEDFEAKARSMGVKDDLKALLSLDVLFFERYDDYTLLSIKDHSEAPKNILILSKKNNILFSEKKITDRDFRLFRSIVAKA
ncbi:MAG: hypothetical protein Q8P02_02270, partial [Candidatus Micrarchaeota archaeon]|nr:hypothetical protein [Candidatus Micrarchaeota archaeon]